MKVPKDMFKKICKDIKIKFIGAKLDYEDKTINLQRMIDKIEILGYEISRKSYS